MAASRGSSSASRAADGIGASTVSSCSRRGSSSSPTCSGIPIGSWIFFKKKTNPKTAIQKKFTQNEINPFSFIAAKGNLFHDVFSSFFFFCLTLSSAMLSGPERRMSA